MSRRSRKKRPQKKEELHQRKGGRLRKAAVVLVIVAIISMSLAAGLLLSGVIGGGPESGGRAAAIVDQLDLTQPNPDFAASATDILEEAGYTVDYYPGEEITVDFYRDLPTHDYDLLILRVHSGMAEETDVATGEKTKREYVSLFTGEPYSRDKYPDEPLGRLGKAEYYEGAPPLFGIAPDFILYSMRDSFDDTLIVMMGCDGLRSERTAQAFLDKGASAFVSWTRSVSASHSDAGTLLLLEKLLVEELPVADAVDQTAAEMGPDPLYGARLRALLDES
ncbi:MAG: hypothetical protein AMJ77_01340 [Dehalococcoidia bacterium SM23_28_2]|nr:MAG: hypothetical protein AMJ77_01340 [Dehalococcoidia bacterium SM23_28_2]